MRMSRENLSEGAREYVSAYQRFIGPRVRALAGANVTAGERFLYDPERATSPHDAVTAPRTARTKSLEMWRMAVMVRVSP